jgi:NAD(P)-dependent dehydrogenase (short-subunit alcohol dehydrogenase family)
MSESVSPHVDEASDRRNAEPDAEPSSPGRSERLKGKIALVTGGGTGIGRAISEIFAREGASVVLSGRRAEPLQEAVQQIRRDGGVATFARGDVTRQDRVEMLVQAAVYNFGGLDIVVNNAGIRIQGTILDTDEKRWDRVLQTNLKGPFLVSRLAVPAMRSRGGGSIVNVASSAGLLGVRGAAAYSAAKGGLVALTRSMALDHAADRIRVNAVCPGNVDSPSAREATVAPGASAADGGAGVQPLGRVGSPEDVARLVLFLASEESSWITGAVISVDGGLPSR